MINHFTERKAINDTEKIFIENEWVFRELSTADFGIDAIVESSINKKPTGKWIALQIKGGDGNFSRTRSGFTFYFSEAHYTYWLTKSMQMPVLIILQDKQDSKIYWQRFTLSNIKQTKKRWKINVPYKNILNALAFRQFIKMFNDIERLQLPKTLNEQLYKEKQLKKELIIKYQPGAGRNKDLQCILNDGRGKIKFSLGYNINGENWNKVKRELSWEDPYYFTLESLQKYLRDLYKKLKAQQQTNILRILRKNVEKMILTGGIQGIARQMFDLENSLQGVYKYDVFITAFELYTGLKKEQYTAQTVGEQIHFQAKGKKYEMNTWVGKIIELKWFIENRSYEEIYTMTDEFIWSEIYIDAGIEKAKFIPNMLREWETYWNTLYNNINAEIGYTSHLDKMKDESYRGFQAFIDAYNDAGDAIKLAREFNDMKLYPIAVITMMNIFNPEVCYDEYCELEFYQGDWDSVCIDEEDDNSPILYIREMNE